MKKWIFTLMIVFSLVSFSKATVIFDPADYADAGWTMAADSMEVVQLNGNYYLKTFLNGWNTAVTLSESVAIPDDETMFKCFAQYAVGTSGFPITGVNSFIQIMGGGKSSAIGAGSNDSIAFYSAAADTSLIVEQVQLAGQETTGWTAVVGDTIWVSRIVSYNPDLIFQPDGHAGAFPAGTKVVEIDGKSYAKVPLDGWNTVVTLDENINSGKAASFSTMAQFAIGTSGFDLSGVNTFIQLMSDDGNISIGAASSATPIKYSNDFAGPISIWGIQLAGQETTGWTAVVGDTLWVGDFETVVVDEPGVVFNPATYPAASLPAGMEIVIQGDDTLLAVTTAGWDQLLPLVADYSMGEDNNLTFKVKVEAGTSGLTIAELNWFMGVNDPDGTQLFTGGGAAADVESLTEVDVYAKAGVSLSAIQIASQQNSGTWDAQDGVVIYFGKIRANKVETVNEDPRVTYTVAYTMDEEITLDGLQLEDAWWNASSAPVDQVVVLDGVEGGPWPASEADNSGEWYAVYDDEFLYLYMDITDDVIVPMTDPDAEGAQVWMNDGVEIFVDILDRRYDLDRLSSEQHQLRYNIDRESADTSAFAHYKGDWGQVKGAASYQFEIAMPWGGIAQGAVDSADVANYVATEIVEGKTISFEVSIIDADEEDGRKSILNWSNNTGEDQAYNTSKYYGQLILGSKTGESAIKKNNTLTAKVYPNPAKETLTVEMEGMTQVVIYNIAGQQVLVHNDQANNTLNVSELVAGLYIVEVRTANGTAVQKVTIK